MWVAVGKGKGKWKGRRACRVGKSCELAITVAVTPASCDCRKSESVWVTVGKGGDGAGLAKAVGWQSHLRHVIANKVGGGPHSGPIVARLHLASGSVGLLDERIVSQGSFRLCTFARCVKLRAHWHMWVE